MLTSVHIKNHPILGPLDEGEPVVFYFNGQAVRARKGDTVASALFAAGIRTFSHSHRLNQSRGIFCSIGHCTDCVMRVDGVENVRTCITKAEDGMQVNSN
jgi:sarcosine oxidase subunit alpha